MREDPPPGFSVIFDPISKSALMHQGDSIIWLPGPFLTYRDAVNAARRSMGNVRACA
jgi:hypothetical protein